LDLLLDATSEKRVHVLYFCEKGDHGNVQNILESLAYDYERVAFIHVEDTQPKPMILYPALWFGPKLQDKIVSDLFPKDWIKIEV